jgi:hypothetical protein
MRKATNMFKVSQKKGPHYVGLKMQLTAEREEVAAKVI